MKLISLSNIPLGTQEQNIDNLIPRLHPVYLPFKTQHKVLTLVQSILEECCFEFGNSWFPRLMRAQKWEEAESIELTQWIKRFSRHMNNIPPSATQTTAGKSLKEVLFATSDLRHSAVHRLPTSAVGVLKMLDAALTFAEALKDTNRAACIERIKNEIAVVVEDVVQHQTLLERKLSDQLKGFKRKRAEIDELERLAVEDMLENDQIYRATAGSAVHDFLGGLQKASCTCASERPNLYEDREAGPGLDEGAQITHRSML